MGGRNPKSVKRRLLKKDIWFSSLLTACHISSYSSDQTTTTMKLAFAIASIAALQQPSIARADCAFGSNYTRYFNSSGYCSSFEVAVGMITQSSASSTTSSGDTNVTTYDEVRDMAIWRVDDKDSTVQCYPSISFETVFTKYPNGSTYNEASGDFEIGLDTTVNSVADGVPLAVPGLYFFKGGRFGFWGSWDSSTNDGGNWDITDAEGDVTDLCEVLGGSGSGDATATTDSSNGDTSAEASSTCADFDTLSAAEAACTARHNCAGLTDPNFGSDCVGNRKEHCAEIKACGDCEAEIRAMFDCEQ